MFINESDQRPRTSHPALHGDEHGGIGRNQFILRHELLDQRVVVDQ